MKLFTLEELEKIIEGNREIDGNNIKYVVNEMRSATRYEDFPLDSKLIQWFCEIVEEMTP